MFSKLPESIGTIELTISDAKMEDCSVLQAIADSWSEKKLVEGEGFPSDYILKCLTEGDLPPLKNASIENYSLKSIYKTGSTNPIGFLDLYYGYPSTDNVWISIFVVSSKLKGQGIGKGAVELVSQEIKKCGYPKIALGVQLKNWPALRFWAKSGFSRILGVFGDKSYAPENFAMIGLEKLL